MVMVVVVNIIIWGGGGSDNLEPRSRSWAALEPGSFKIPYALHISANLGIRSDITTNDQVAQY
jgi:hypothetical protein